MTDSAPLKKILDEAREYDAKLRADDSRFKGSALIVLDDGTIIHQQSSFLMKRTLDGAPWIILFGEHASPQAWDADDIVFYREFQPQFKYPEELP